MLASIWEDVKKEFSYGNMVTRLIILNVALFVFVNLVKIIMYISGGGELPDVYNDFLHFFCMSSDWLHNLTHPWVLLTSMFLHEGFWHILWNMLFLMWFGRIIGDLIGNKKILPLYLLGGLAGAIAYFVSANLLPYGGGEARYALGASASVMAVVVASGVVAPDYNLRLLFIGDVKLKYIVAVLVFLDLIAISNNSNTGGHFAHIGGALFGWFFIRQLQEGRDMSIPVNKMFDKMNGWFDSIRGRKPRRGPKVVYKNPDAWRRSRKGNAVTDLSHQEQLDGILEKIKKTGYESLTEEEKEFLFNASKK